MREFTLIFPRTIFITGRMAALAYLTKFDSHEIVRGQQGEPWMGQVAWPDYPDTLSRRKNTQSWRHDWVNRQFITTETAMPQCKTFTSGLDFY